MKKTIFTAILLMIFPGLIAGGGPAWAQSIFLEPNNGAGIHLEALRPGLQGVNLTNISFAFFLSGRVRVGEGFHLRAEVPYATYNLDESYYVPTAYGSPYSQPNSSSSFGNPYLGLDFGDPDSGFQGEVGFRIPVLSDYKSAAFIGATTDPVERLEAFSSNVTPLYAGSNYRYKSDNGFGLRLRVVPVFWLYTGTSSTSDNDLFFVYSAQAWYEDEKVGVGGGFSGRLIVTGEDDGLGDRTLHQFGFFANFSFGRIMPGFQVRIPLDRDLKDSDPYGGGGGLGTNYSLSIGIKL